MAIFFERSQAAHPEWQPTEDGQRLINNLANFLVESTEFTQSALRSTTTPSQISSYRCACPVRRTCLPSLFSLGVAADPTEVLCSMQLSDINRLHEAFADSRSNQSSTFESGLALRRGV
jgi:hypothetical protein